MLTNNLEHVKTENWQAMNMVTKKYLPFRKEEKLQNTPSQKGLSIFMFPYFLFRNHFERHDTNALY